MSDRGKPVRVFQQEPCGRFAGVLFINTILREADASDLEVEAVRASHEP